MGKKDDDKKEKTLATMPIKELRALGLAIEGLGGVHNMHRIDLVAAVKKSKGEAVKETVDVRALKQKVGELKEKRNQAKEAGNAKLAELYRRRISSLKKQTRKAEF